MVKIAQNTEVPPWLQMLKLQGQMLLRGIAFQSPRLLQAPHEHFGLFISQGMIRKANKESTQPRVSSAATFCARIMLPKG
ncbi:hypothetical protein RRG08_023034 [Elysia crispata]|uniref:Uncharacterized protein n=1 Tax=Elysia crispata TaxID=231223 RepID=A0AAE1D0X6_9GAST|nr:hypothetical protein RRG08_023034 [Elysia crispata]